MYASIYIPDFPVCAVTLGEPALAARAVAIVDGTPTMANVVAVNERGCRAGVKLGMPKLTVAGIVSMEIRHRSPAAEASAHAALLDLGLAFSPHVEETALDTVVLDLAGLDRLIGPPEEIARRLAVRASELGLEANIALAANPDAAVHAARGFRGVTLIPAGEESERLGPLPVEVLAPPLETLETLRRWGIHTLRALAALPTPDLSERLGQPGVALQNLARGATSRHLVPIEAALVFEESMELEYPIELLEPLAFILGRLLDQLCARLAARSLATNEIRLRLELENGIRGSGFAEGSRESEVGSREEKREMKLGPAISRPSSSANSESRTPNPALCESRVPSPESRSSSASPKPHFSLRTPNPEPRIPFSSASPQSIVPSPSPSQSTIDNRKSSILHLPVPTCNSKLLLKLLLLNLQSDPPPAPVMKVTLSAEPVKPRVSQAGLFLPLSPDPEKLELTLARIAGVVGKGNVGSPELVDTHRPGAFRMRRFGGTRDSQEKTGFGIRDSGFADEDRDSGLGTRDSQNCRLPMVLSAAKDCRLKKPRIQSFSPNPESRTANPGSSCESRVPSPESRSSSANPEPPTPNPGILALRIFRPPLPAKVEVRDGRPVRVDASEIRGNVILAAGPWRTSGDWWADEPWDREEWDVEILSAVRGSRSVAGHQNSEFGVRGSQSTQARQKTLSNESADYADEKGGMKRQESRRYLHNLQIESSVFRTKEITLCRIYRDLQKGSWFVEGFYD